jgi:hypothetical protein
MYKHHKDTIENITYKLMKQEEVLAVIIGGSIAHRFERETSDVDIMIVVSDEDYSCRTKSGQIHYFEKESCTYEAGYIDGKYISIEFMKKVALSGSEPARFAFEGAWAAYSKIHDLNEILQQIVRYPTERQKRNICRFYAQFEAWKWYCEEAIKKDNLYLLNHSVSNLILFAGRLILAHNQVLYPYHKWFLKVLSNVNDKPIDLITCIDTLLKTPNRESIEAFYQNIKTFRNWEVSEVNWPSMFMEDSELNWLNGSTPICDI